MNIQAALVRSILERWQHYDWTIQGFGFARTKIADVGRIHVWDSRLAVPLVSAVHSHPWPLKSTIISGELTNHRFTVDAESGYMPYQHSRIATGEGGGLIGEQQAVLLAHVQPETYVAATSYRQRPEEIHRTAAQDGTVTLLERPQGPPLEEASVYWPTGMSWVSAEPRTPANAWELSPIIELALARWYPAGASEEQPESASSAGEQPEICCTPGCGRCGAVEMATGGWLCDACVRKAVSANP